jgi:hypothetical protein
MMLPNFTIRSLPTAEFRRAWPLVSVTHPGLTLRRWLAFARTIRSSGRKAGMIAVEDQRGLIHAVAVYRVADDVEKGRLLVVQPVICARLPGRDLDDVLAEGLKDLASVEQCAGVVVETPVSGAGLQDTAKALIDRGFIRHAVATYAPVPPHTRSSH